MWGAASGSVARTQHSTASRLQLWMLLPRCRDLRRPAHTQAHASICRDAAPGPTVRQATLASRQGSEQQAALTLIHASYEAQPSANQCRQVSALKGGKNAAPTLTQASMSEMLATTENQTVVSCRGELVFCCWLLNVAGCWMRAGSATSCQRLRARAVGACTAAASASRRAGSGNSLAA